MEEARQSEQGEDLQTTQPAELRLQVHPDRAPDLDVSVLEHEFMAVINSLPSTVRSKVEREQLPELHVNLVAETRDRKQLWEVLNRRLYKHPVLGIPLSSSSMALCTGSDRWNDYLLLHHYDPLVQLDVCPDA